jgi:hypothetical protein
MFDSEYKEIKFRTSKTVLLATNYGYAPIIRVWCSGKAKTKFPNFAITQYYFDDLGQMLLYTDQFIFYTTEKWETRKYKYFYKVFGYENNEIIEEGEIQ